MNTTRMILLSSKESREKDEHDTHKRVAPVRRSDPRALSSQTVEVLAQGQILLVGDDRFQRFFQRSLPNLAHLLAGTDSASNALERAQSERLDLIILQAGNEPAAALALCEKLKRSPHLPYVPVMIMLPRPSTSLQCEGYRHGANEVLSAPCDPQLLEFRVAALLKYRYAVSELEGARLEMEARVESRTHELQRTVAALRNEVQERRRAEEELKQTEVQLLHAQKMEALGQLAGGVAHDFNNLLMAVLGYCDLAVHELSASHPVAAYLETIKKSGLRAQALTRQLLAFGRRQVLKPETLSLNRSVHEADRLVRRMLREDVEVTLDLQEPIAPVRADPVQIVQVLMNLAANARDAMPLGGKLVIATREVAVDAAFAAMRPPMRTGRYVCLSVSDTGCGMTPDVLRKVFDPFFTTKPRDQGTGLGLATVYGIVKQSQGYIWAFSEPGQGSRFEIYLPATGGSAAISSPALPAVARAKGTETILVVEDEAAVRELVRMALVRNGYRVICASDGEEARQLAEDRPETIHLLLSDVVMPRLGGYELARRLRAARPGLRVLFMSGYNEASVRHHGMVVPDTHFIEKPFEPGVLAERIRSILDAEV
ncbi:MAG: response regulator [Planctomycetes bacterium]|nr:response regulator [Planctomycetota bacterium]